MTPRFHALPALLALTALSRGQDDAVWMQRGEQALAAGLWEVAAGHFENGLATPGLSPAVKSRTAVLLAESWIREGRFAEAFHLLGQSFVEKSPEAQFWKAQSLIGLGQLQEAIQTLAPVAENPSAPCHPEAVFTISNLQLALGKPESALATLRTLSESPQAALSAKARFHEAEILLDLGRSAAARETMPPDDLLGPAYKVRSSFIKAHLALREGRPDEALAGFETLLDPTNPYHPAALGLVDALMTKNAREEAVSFLLSFIQKYPDSPELDGLFERLLVLLPAKPAPHDPILDRIEKDWIPPARIPSPRLVSDPEGLVDGDHPTTDDASASELLAHSLFTRAVGLLRMDGAAAQAESRTLFNRLRFEFPEHPLAARSMLEQARWNLLSGNIERAMDLLALLRNFSPIPGIAGEAAFLEARTAYQNGDSRKAVRLFEEAATTLDESAADTAKLNAALVKVTTAGDVMTVAQTDLPVDPAIRASLELERALSEPDPSKRRKALDSFLAAHPDHTRSPEARLAAAECALTGPHADPAYARAQLETLNTEPEKSALLDKTRLALLKLHLEDLSNEHANAIATARSIIDANPDAASVADATMVLGRNLFLTQNYNDARIAFEKLAASDARNPDRSQAAWLLAARSAALVSTSQSKQDALILFDNAIKLPGPLSSVAKLEKARLMIDMNLVTEAAELLTAWFGSLPDGDPMFFPVGFLLGEAISKQGNSRATALADALAVYDKLLAQSEKQPAFLHRIQYLRGRSLEQLPDPKDPTRKREREALAAYYSVLETNTPPKAWEDFENCGFGALRLLCNAGRWPAAVACARKIASFNGPRAKEASDLAAKIQLEHMIWED